MPRFVLWDSRDTVNTTKPQAFESLGEAMEAAEEADFFGHGDGPNCISSDDEQTVRAEWVRDGGGEWHGPFFVNTGMNPMLGGNC